MCRMLNINTMRKNNLKILKIKNGQYSTTSTGKEIVLILGSGWSGYRLALDIDKSKYRVKMVSPRNHFLFTPLLPSTAVGTLEFRCIQEPVRTIAGLAYFQANCDNIDFERRKVECTDAFKEGHKFVLNFDKIVIAVGCETNTFGIKGVENNENVFFLKQLSHARAIRNRLIDCFERASSPAATELERSTLLTFVIVGGGPTSIEFAAELHDFLHDDVAKWYPELKPLARIIVVEATGSILGSFQKGLVTYVENLFKRRKIELLTNTLVKEIKSNVAIFANGNELSFGLMVWSTGIKQLPLIDKLPSNIARARNGRLLIDSYLQIQKSSTADGAAEGASDFSPLAPKIAYAMGDCAGDLQRPLPALAQVASQQGSYLATVFNKGSTKHLSALSSTFKYNHFGSMASVGEWKGIIDTTQLSKSGEESHGGQVKGVIAFLLWRAAYWTKQVSWTNKLLIPMFWFKSFLFGRDISRF